MKKLRILATVALISTAFAAHAQNLEWNLSLDHKQNQTLADESNPFLATLSPVPEPSPYLLFALGALVLGARLTRPDDPRH
jgi:hypothetical protein